MPRHINLLDPRAKASSPYLTAIVMGVPVLLVLVLTLAVGGVAKYRVSVLKQQLVELGAQLQPMQAELDQAQSGLGIEKVNADLNARLAKAEAQLKARQDIQGALKRGELGSSQGFSEFMRAFARRTVPGVWLTGLTLESGGKEVTLSGRAVSPESVAILVRQLREEPMLKGRVISTLQLTPVTMPLADQASVAAQTSAASAPLQKPGPRVYAFVVSTGDGLNKKPSDQVSIDAGIALAQAAKVSP